MEPAIDARQSGPRRLKCSVCSHVSEATAEGFMPPHPPARDVPVWARGDLKEKRPTECPGGGVPQPCE